MYKVIGKNSIIFSACLLFLGCSGNPVLVSTPITEEYPQLPRPDTTLNIKGLGPCHDNPDRSLLLNSNEPVTVLVHGCYGSAGRFRSLSKVLAYHGQQSACFSYDDRDSMMVSSRQLADAIEEIESKMSSNKITVIGHSQGGLVSRKALVETRDKPIKSNANLELVTVSAPLSGIRAADACANSSLRKMTLGIMSFVCWVVSGDKWHEITYASDYIQNPGKLTSSVQRHLLITTDETNSCRNYDKSGKCIEDDFVFTLDEQNLPGSKIDGSEKKIEIKAGHVEIVGSEGVIPNKLIKVLQQEGLIRKTDHSRTAHFNTFLTHLYN